MIKKRKTILLFFGPPGSGKGTQSDMLAEKLRIPVISPGELLRAEKDLKTDDGRIVAHIAAKGEIVPDEIVEKIIDKRLEKKDAIKGFIFDGYPRRVSQTRSLMKRLKKITDKNSLVYAILIHISNKEVKKRIGGRRVCDCGAAYHIKYNPTKKRGICDLCGKKTYTREDDTPKVIGHRLKLYKKNINPMLDYWRKNDKLIVVDGERDIMSVFGEMLSKLKEVGVAQ